MSDKLAFIFPGYNLSPDRESYRQIKEFYSSNGFEPTILDIEWSRDFWENVELFRSALSDQLENYQNPEIHFFGHSWGAASALVLSQDIGLETQLLAGLSPVFREDRELLSTVETFTFQAREYFYSVLKETPETVEKRPVLAEISSENIGKIVLLYGETEYYGPVGNRA
jgi:pimeloyl-ACP methyl ester carboxylesterase